MLNRLRARAKALKRETTVLVLAYQDARTPWYARLVVALVVAYLFSPIDLIPDFIPVLGYLDDLLLVPLGITLALRLIPPQVMAAARARAGEQTEKRSLGGYLVAGLIVVVWGLALWWVGGVVGGWLNRP